MNARECFISQLARFLRLHGDGILNGSCKFSLTTHALSLLNIYFSNIAVLEQHEGDYKHLINDDIKYLHSFVAKISCLKIHHSGGTLRGGVDLSEFKSLKVLELHKVPFHLISGLKNLKFQLQTLVCNRSVCDLKEIFLDDSTEHDFKVIWKKLTELNIAFNHIDGFTVPLNIIPNVTFMDASHNNFKYIDEIQVLEKLVQLNLSFNLLENIPVLNPLCCHSLKVLLLKNNALEDLYGIQVLINLQELDVSLNCLSVHSILKPLCKLSNLKVLHLDGNPIFFHEKHRLITSQFLNPEVLKGEFILDDKILTSKDLENSSNLYREKRFNSRSLNFHQTSVNIIVEESDTVPYFNKNIMNSSISSSEVSSTESKSFKTEESDNLKNSSEKFVERIDNDVIAINHKRFKDKKNMKPVINDDAENKVVSNTPPHIQMKYELEKRRREFKDGWLIPTDSFEALEEDKISQNATILNDESVENRSRLIEQEVSDQNLNQNSDQYMSSKKSENLNTAEVLEESDLKIENTVQEGVFNRNSDLNEFKDSYNQYTRNDSTDEEHKLKEWKISTENENEFDAEEEDDQANIFIVTKINTYENQDIFIKIKDNFLKEMDSFSGKINEHLDLKSLISIEKSEKGESHILNLYFDSAKSSRQTRQYSMEDKEVCNEIFSVCETFINNQLFSEFNTNIYQCMKCLSKFSRQNAHQKVLKTKNPSTVVECNLKKIGQTTDFIKETDVCPNCGSDVIIMESLPSDEMPLTLKKNLLQLHETLSSDSDIPSNKENFESLDKTKYANVQTSQHYSSSPVSSNLKNAQYDAGDLKVHFNNNITTDIDEMNLVLNNNFQTEDNKHNDPVNLINVFNEKENYNSENFTIINPRRKLYLELKIFNQDEYLEAYLEANIISFPTCSEFDGFLAISNKKIYIMKFNDKTNDTLDEENITEFSSVPLHYLKEIHMLLGNQGFTIASPSRNKMFLFFVCDADLCNSFRTHLIEIQIKVLDFQPKFIWHTEEFLNQISYEVLLHYYSDKDNSELQHKIEMNLFVYWTSTEQKENMPVCLIVTHEDIILSSIKFKKYNKLNQISELFHYIPFEKQQILDLLEVHLSEDLLRARICFHNEDNDTRKEWTISTRTKTSLFSFLTAIKGTWEDSFGIDLPVYLS